MAPNFDAFHFRIQNYKKNLIYANEIAKNVRKICENVRNLTESAIKDGSLPQKCGGKETNKISRLCCREIMCLITI